MLERSASRRRLIGGIAGGAAALALHPVLGASSRPTNDLSLEGTSTLPSLAAHVPGSLPTTHMAWVWQFNQDGEPARIREVLAAHGLGIALKTHDGVTWMSKYDTSRNAVTGPERMEELANFFEAGGVPFHAWCVVHGTDALKESAMAASVLKAGARSLSIDLESYTGFWRGTSINALQYIGSLRAAQPTATIMTTIDARPWEYDRIPLKEFAMGSNAIAPQVYWSDFGTNANILKYRQAGADPGIAGVTPLFALHTATSRLASYGLPIHPIGPGLISDSFAWSSFINEAYSRDVESMSVWRFGTTTPGVLQLLKANPPKPRSYVVQMGDSLGGLAARWGVSIEALAAVNSIANPNLLVVGDRLLIPRGPAAGATAATPIATSAPVVASGGGTYTVQPGDSVGALAVRWGTTSARIAQASGLSNQNVIVVGQQLRIP